MADKKAQLIIEGAAPVELPILTGTVGPDVIDVRGLTATGRFTFDPGFMSTASCESKITYIDGDNGILLHRGYPIEQLAEQSDYLETCYLLLNGELPTAEQKAQFVSTVKNHTMVHEQLKTFFNGFRRDAHPMAVMCGVVGGGSGMIRPGAAARAAHGVLFLDEAPEFAAAVLDALRQPLESGLISIHRANGVAHFPGQFQLVMAANPCPCGQFGAQDQECTCPPNSRRRYLGRLSGPLLDRIDIQLTVRRITAAQLRLSQDALAQRGVAEVGGRRGRHVQAVDVARRGGGLAGGRGGGGRGGGGAIGRCLRLHLCRFRGRCEGAPDPEVHAARVQGRDGRELLGGDERARRAQQDRAGADAQVLRAAGDDRGEDRGRGRRDACGEVVLGEPVAGVPERVGPLGERDRVPEGLGTGRSGRDGGEVEDREGDAAHGGSPGGAGAVLWVTCGAG